MLLETMDVTNVTDEEFQAAAQRVSKLSYLPDDQVLIYYQIFLSNN
jgi:hypothetical protein